MTQLHPAKSFGFRVHVVPHRQARSVMVSSRDAHVNPRIYDHRIREQVVRTGNPELFPELEIPRKTALSWIRRGARHVVTLDEAGWMPAHHARIAKLERRVAMLSALLDLVLTLLRLSGFELERARISDAANKRRLLSAVERARKVIPLSAALRVLRFSSSRYRAWVRAESVLPFGRQTELSALQR